MNRQISCGRSEAAQRARVARAYLETAEVAKDESERGYANVAVGNAVLAGIAASDAICCLRLGRRSRAQDHQAAATLLRSVEPGGRRLAGDLSTLLTVKDLAHYGEGFVNPAKLKSALRAAERLVSSAEEALAH